MNPRHVARRLVRLLPAAGLCLALLASGGTTIPAVQAQPPVADLVAARAALANRPATSLPEVSTLTLDDVPPADVMPGRVTVTFGSDVSEAQARRAIASIGGSTRLAIPRLSAYEVALPEGESVADGIAMLSALPGALRAEPQVRREHAFHPNDPLYAQYQSYLPLLHAEQAWDIQQGDPRVTVAVLDSGVDITHPDLAGQIWTNPNPGADGCGDDEHGCNFVDPSDVDPSCPNFDPDPAPNSDIRPYYYHGTFVSGVIGAATNNGIGVAGVSPHVSIMPVRVGDCIRPNDVAIADGLIYAADNGAWIVNLSVGGNCGRPPSVLSRALAYAEQRNVVIVAAAGNSGTPCVETPANQPGVIAVGALAAGGQTRATFSSYGPQISVVAPGQRIISTVPKTDRPAPRDLYDQEDGTSFSAPMVAGLAHLLLSQNSVMTPDVVRGLIERGAVPLPDGRTPGWAGAGRIDLAASLRLVPAGFYGAVSFDGAPVADGTPVTALINGRACGQTTTYSSDAGSAYVLYVSAASDVAGCGTPSSTVTFVVGDQVAGSAAWQPVAIPQDLAVGAAGATSGRRQIPGAELLASVQANLPNPAWPIDAVVPEQERLTLRRGRSLEQRSKGSGMV